MNTTPESFITQREFARFKKQLREEFGGLKSALDSQCRKIEQLGSEWESGAQEVKASLAKNHQIEEENKTLRAKIAELESSILCLQREKSILQRNLDPHPHDPSPKFRPCARLNTQDSLSKPTLSAGSPLSSHGSRPHENSPQYFIGSNPPTANEDGTEEDGEDRIESVWADSNKPDKKTEQLNEKRQSNPHSKQFTVEREPDRSRITKTNGMNFFSPSHNFLHKQPLPARGVAKYRVRRTKVKDIFLMGVASSEILGVENAFRHKELLAYSSSGDVWAEGDSKRAGREVKQGQVVEMVVDRAKGALSWSVNNKLEAEIRIPPPMAEKDLFLALLMFNKGDTLELLDSE